MDHSFPSKKLCVKKKRHGFLAMQEEIAALKAERERLTS
jgi:hypothetical protein